MDRLQAMQLFVTVAESSSFAAAARRHASSAARVTRAVATLEAHLGARLLHRTTRAVRLTEAGARYLTECRRILADVQQAESLVRSTHGQPTGQLSITAPRHFGRLHVAPVVSAFLQRHRRVSMRVLFADNVVDLYEHNIDVAIRIAHMPSSGLRAIRVGQVRRVVCASPSYLRARGVPRHPRELADHDVIAFSGAAEPQPWTFSVADRKESCAVRPRLIVNSTDLAISAACAGDGITRVLSYQVADELARQRLRVVLQEFELPALPVQIVHAEGRTTTARVSAFVELATARLSESLAALHA